MSVFKEGNSSWQKSWQSRWPRNSNELSVINAKDFRIGQSMLWLALASCGYGWYKLHKRSKIIALDIPVVDALFGHIFSREDYCRWASKLLEIDTSIMLQRCIQKKGVSYESGWTQGWIIIFRCPQLPNFFGGRGEFPYKSSFCRDIIHPEDTSLHLKPVGRHHLPMSSKTPLSCRDWSQPEEVSHQRKVTLKFHKHLWASEEISTHIDPKGKHLNLATSWYEEAQPMFSIALGDFRTTFLHSFSETRNEHHDQNSARKTSRKTAQTTTAVELVW